MPRHLKCVPIVASRVEQRRDFFGLRVNTGQVGPFVQIAINAGQRKIVEIVSAAVDFGGDMLDMEGGQRGIVLVESAIFTAIFGTFPDAGLRALVHPP